MKQKYPHPIINQKINSWTIKEESIDKKYNRIYLCECECGEKNWITKHDLVTDKSTKCKKCRSKETGEKLLKDLTGQKINSWTVLERIGVAKNSRTPLWLCKCDCGKELEVRASNLHTGKSTCCGKCNIYEEISLTKWSQIKKGAEYRNIEFNITIEEAWDLYLKQDKKCALTGIEIFLYIEKVKGKAITASLDRIDSNKGYSKENCQWVHKTVNGSKGKFNNKQFISLCHKIANMNKNTNEDWENVDMKKSNKIRKGKK